jgi:hypothetical protein
VVRLALAEATARTGIPYVASGCGAGASCFSRASETDGQSAAYVEVAVQGYGDASRCYIYLDSPGGAWQVEAMACGARDGFAPTVNGVVTVHATFSCGRVRTAVGLSSAVVRCLASGSRVTVTDGPEYAEGEIWWPVTDASTAGVIAQELLVDPAAQVPARP